MAANDRQVGGAHYQAPLQHWDLSVLFRWDPFQYQITKYTMRWRDKNGLIDVEKVGHFTQKYMEEIKAGRIDTTPRPVMERQHWLTMLVPPNHVVIPLGSVSPTGWLGYTFEGTKDNEDWYRCKQCREHFKVGNLMPPFNHVCKT